MKYHKRSLVPLFCCLFSIMVKAADYRVLVSQEGKEIKFSPDLVAVSSVLQGYKQQELVDYPEQQLILLCQLVAFEKNYLQKRELSNQSIDLFKQLFPSDEEAYNACCFELADFFNLSSIRNLLVEQATTGLNYQDLKNGCYEHIEMAYSPKFLGLLERRLEDKENDQDKTSLDEQYP